MQTKSSGGEVSPPTPQALELVDKTAKPVFSPALNSTALVPAGALPLIDVPRVPMLSREQFLEEHVRPGTPVVLTGFGHDWPAMQKWTPAYFRERFGNRRVMAVTTTKQARGHAGHYGVPVEMSMNEYLDAVIEKDEDLRLAARHTAEIAGELVDDFTRPDLGRGYSDDLLWLFLGSKGSRTPLHFDFGPFHVFHTIFFGEKTMHLFPQREGRNLHQLPLTARSKVDPLRPDTARFPRLANIHGWRATFGRGETLFLPAGCWHDAYYHSASLALTLRFTEDARFVKSRVLYRLGIGAISGVLEALAPDRWPALQERLAR